MIVIAGILYLNNNVVADHLKNDLNSALSRKRTIEPLCISRKQFYLTIGCFQECENSEYFYENDRFITVLLGNPYLAKCREGNECSRSAQLAEINYICENSSWDTLKNNCRGVFSVIHYNKQNNQLIFVSDKLGVRPIYYYIDDEKVIFSSALRILEDCPLVLRKFDAQGVSEIVAFGFSLAKRTPYQDVKRIAAAEIVQFENKNEHHAHYWRWDSIPEAQGVEKDVLARDSFCKFEDGLNIRLAGDDVTLAFLSGGLDSRCIVSSLKQYCSHVHAFNFSQPQSQDRFFAMQFAEAAEVDYCEFAFESSADWSQMLVNSWEDKSAKTQYLPERPWMVWSGDGGSVGTGCVYLNQNIMKASIEDDVDKVIELYLDYNKISLPSKILSSSFQKEVRELVTVGVRDEMSRFSSVNHAQALYLFLMENDQRRHLDLHFENLDIHNLEFHLPFFDSFFLESVCAVPIEDRINHGFYMDWFQKFPPVARSVPWQTYPGHRTCPIASKQKLQYQWEDSDARNKILQKNNYMSMNLKSYCKASFPGKILSRKALLLAWLCHALHLKKIDYLFDAADIYMKYDEKCNHPY